jgi:hypothetical protein
LVWHAKPLCYAARCSCLRCPFHLLSLFGLPGFILGSWWRHGDGKDDGRLGRGVAMMMMMVIWQLSWSPVIPVNMITTIISQPQSFYHSIISLLIIHTHFLVGYLYWEIVISYNLQRLVLKNMLKLVKIHSFMLIFQNTCVIYIYFICRSSLILQIDCGFYQCIYIYTRQGMDPGGMAGFIPGAIYIYTYIYMYMYVLGWQIA